MRVPDRVLLVVSAVAFFAAAPVAFASAPAGVWAVPSSVTVSDAAGDTPSVIITGVFTVHTGQGSEGGRWGYAGFEPTVAGYMHYVCKAGDKDMCLLQWGDISKAAEDKACVGWGENTAHNGVVHATGSPTGAPDPWDLAMGVVSGFTPCEYVASYDPPAGDVASDGNADVADPDPSDVPPVSDVVEDAADVPPVGDTGPGDAIDDSGDDSVDPVDAVDAVAAVDAVTADTSPSDVAANDAAGEADTTSNGATGESADDKGCAGGKGGAWGVFGLLGLGFVVRRRFAVRGLRG